MPSKSKSQQRFFGVVKGIQKGTGKGKGPPPPTKAEYLYPNPPESKHGKNLHPLHL